MRPWITQPGNIAAMCCWVLRVELGSHGLGWLLVLAAAALDDLVDGIASPWLERVSTALYASHPELGRQDILDNTPNLIRGVTEALRRGQPEALGAP